MDRLILRYEPDPLDEVGQIWFDMRGRFFGIGSFWSNLSELPALIEQLGAYPLRGPIAERWGYDLVGEGGNILGLGIEPCNLKGDLAARVEIADLHDWSQRIRVGFITSYAELDAFRRQLIEMHRERAGEAFLVAKE